MLLEPVPPTHSSQRPGRGREAAKGKETRGEHLGERNN